MIIYGSGLSVLSGLVLSYNYAGGLVCIIYWWSGLVCIIYCKCAVWSGLVWSVFYTHPTYLHIDRTTVDTTSVGLAQARPNYKNNYYTSNIAICFNTHNRK